MKKRNKTYSVIIVSDALSSNKEFVVSSKLVRNSIIAISLLLLISGFVIYDYLTISFNKEKMRRLEKQNIVKAEQIETLTATVKSLEVDLEKMKEYKEKIMIASGLTSPYALKEVGSGGFIENIDSKNISKDSINVIKGKKGKNLVSKTKTIRDDANKIVNTLKYVYSVIDKQKVRLASTPSIWPTKGYLTDTYGWRIHPFTGKRSFHYGQDIATQLGNSVVATANGFVLVAEHRDVLGNLIIIDHGFGYLTWYGHLASFNVKVGQRVKRGQVIGAVGNTGRSNAPHLHYEVRVFGKPQNPMNYIID